jgi:hypothetical protein
MNEVVRLSGHLNHLEHAAEARRLFSIPDRFLARAIISLCRRAREAHGPLLAKAPSRYNDPNVFLVWDLGPEIAFRLGETDFQQLERRRSIHDADVMDLRAKTWTAISQSKPLYLTGHIGIEPWQMIRTDVTMGNPLFIGLDRLTPVGLLELTRDQASTKLYATCIARGWEPELKWTPTLS